MLEVGAVIGHATPTDEEAYYIYALRDSDNEIFYVGVSANPQARLKQHVAEAVMPDSVKQYWNNGGKHNHIRAHECRICLQVLAIVHGRDAAFFEEMRWIVRMHDAGHKLLNTSRLRSPKTKEESNADA